MADAPGVYVKEKTGGGARPIQPASSSIPAFVGVCKKGPTTRAVKITSFTQFLRIFGGVIATSYMAEAVEGFFKNAGDGAVCYVGRAVTVAGNTSAAFTLQTASTGATKGSISSGANAFPVALVPGETFSGKVDGGGAVVLTVSATPATKTCTGGTYAAGAGGDSITFTNVVMGVTITQTIDLSAVAGTQAAYLAALNTLAGATAANSGLDIVITSDQKGSGAALAITALGGAAAAKLGVSVSAGTNAGPNNVVNIAQVTAAEFVTLAEAAYAGSTTTAPTATSVMWETDTAGAAGSVQFSAGTGVAKITGFDNAVHSGAASGAAQNCLAVAAANVGEWGNDLSVLVAKVDSKAGTLTADLTTGDTFLRVSTTTAAKLAPGDSLRITDSAATIIARVIVKSVNGTKVSFSAAVSFSGGPITASGSIIWNETFTLSVYNNTSLVYGPQRDLRMSELSLRNYFVSRINGDGTNPETPVVVTDSALASSSTVDPRPVNTSSDAAGDALTGGAESTAYVDANYSTALALLDKVKEIRLVATPGATGIATPGVISKAVADYCSGRTDCVGILEPPAGTALSGVVAFKDSRIGSTSYAAMYAPWIKINDPNGGPPVVCPPVGHVCGRIVNAHRAAGVSRAPAGTDMGLGRIIGAVGVEGLLPDEDFDDGLRGSVNDGNINVIRNMSSAATIYGGRTLEAGEYLFLNVRLATNYFKASMLEGTQFAVFAGPTEETFGRIRRTLDAFFRRHYPRDLEGETVEDSFSVVCDARNNPEESKKAGNTNVSVELAIPGTTERVNIDVSQKQQAQVLEGGQ